MTPAYILLIALLIAMFVAMRARRAATGATPPPALARARRPRMPVPKSPGAPPAPKAPVEVFEWDGRPAAAGALDERCKLVRDRYIAARFPGVFRGSSDLREFEYVVRIARQYFEEGLLDRADELFALAIEQSPQDVSMRLAQLEIAFLARDAELFTRLARELRALHAELAEWADVVRLGHAIAPDDPLFGARPGARDHEHYGPWPDMPNWIQASWDLTPEVQAADFHRAMAERARAPQRPALRRVA